MARLDIDTIQKVDKVRTSIHDKVTTTYSVFESNGNKYVQIDTYGNCNRDLPGKISQSIQFDTDSAKFLVKLLIDSFEMFS